MSDASLVPAFQARDFVEAQLVRGLLASEGLQAVLPGEELNDEFAVAARMAGTLYTVVLVPESQLAEAQAIVAAWQARAADDRLVD